MSAWTVIAHTEVGSGGAANITFSSIPATYTDLVLVTSLRVTTAAATQVLQLRVNGTTANYSERVLYGDGSAAASASQSPSSFGWMTITNGTLTTANTFNSAAIYIPNYAGSTAKSFSSESVAEDNSSNQARIFMNAGLWNDTAAITTLALIPTADNIAQYSSATLFGVTKGSSGGVTVS